jgi:hypothetical protein
MRWAGVLGFYFAGAEWMALIRWGPPMQHIANCLRKLDLRRYPWGFAKKNIDIARLHELIYKIWVDIAAGVVAVCELAGSGAAHQLTMGVTANAAKCSRWKARPDTEVIAEGTEVSRQFLPSRRAKQLSGHFSGPEEFVVRGDCSRLFYSAKLAI